MSRLRDFTERDYSPIRYLSLAKAHNGDAAYRSGWWRGPEGLVMIVSIRGTRPHLRMELLANGRVHTRSWAHAFGDRTIARLAREFAQDFALDLRGC